MPWSPDHLTREDLAALVESGRELSAQIDLASLLGSILETACGLTDSPDSAAILHDKGRDALYFAGATGANAPKLMEAFGRDAPQRVPMSSKAGEVFLSGKPLIQGDLAGDVGHYKGADRQTGHTTQSMLCVPLRVDGRTVGVVQLLNKRSGQYSERDLELLEGFASQAAIAIRNAQLFEDLLAHMGLVSRALTTSPFALMDELDQPPREEDLTVLFADMRSFTQLSQLLPPLDLQAALNQFLTMLCDEVLRYDGYVNKLVGDGIVALFRGDDHARRAVQSAFSMVDRFGPLRAEWDRSYNESLHFLDIGVGIATDKVTLTTLGSRQVRDFTPIGPAVNLASALEFDARNGLHVLSDQRTYASVPDLVEPVAEPGTFELTKPGQARGYQYKRFPLVRRSGATSAEGPVFLSHNGMDKPVVRQLTAALKARGVAVWLDEEQLIPGRPWQDGLEEAIAQASSAAVVFGPNGLGPWEIPEMRACLDQLVTRGMPVIPVLLPGVPTVPALPLFLSGLTWVDLRGGMSDEGVDRLVWGIRGTRT